MLLPAGGIQECARDDVRCGISSINLHEIIVCRAEEFGPCCCLFKIWLLQASVQVIKKGSLVAVIGKLGTGSIVQ